MPPLGPLRKNDGPACRVCGCTQHNICVSIALVDNGDDTASERSFACSWVTPTSNYFPALCSACAGTVDDAVEAVRRAGYLMEHGQTAAAREVATAFIDRHRRRLAGEFIP